MGGLAEALQQGVSEACQLLSSRMGQPCAYAASPDRQPVAGFQVLCSGFRCSLFQVPLFRVPCSRFRIPLFAFPGSAFPGSVFHVPGSAVRFSGFRFSGFRFSKFRVPCSGFRCSLFQVRGCRRNKKGGRVRSGRACPIIFSPRAAFLLKMLKSTATLPGLAGLLGACC